MQLRFQLCVHREKERNQERHKRKRCFANYNCSLTIDTRINSKQDLNGTIHVLIKLHVPIYELKMVQNSAWRCGPPYNFYLFTIQYALSVLSQNWTYIYNLNWKCLLFVEKDTIWTTWLLVHCCFTWKYGTQFYSTFGWEILFFSLSLINTSPKSLGSFMYFRPPQTEVGFPYTSLLWLCLYYII